MLVHEAIAYSRPKLSVRGTGLRIVSLVYDYKICCGHLIRQNVFVGLRRRTEVDILGLAENDFVLVFCRST